MAKDRFKTGDSPTIRVESCGGDLVIRGTKEPGLQVGGQYEMQEDEKGYRITGKGDLNLSIPAGATISVGEVGGDLVVKHMAVAGEYERVRGDVIFSNTGGAQITYIHGDLVARKMTGALRVDEVHGDVAARGITVALFQDIHGDLAVRYAEGSVAVTTIHGDTDLRSIEGDVSVGQSYRDVNLSNVSGQVNVEKATGDIRLRGGLSGGDHSLAAEGDVIVRWPVGMPLNLTVTARRVDNRLPLEDVVEKDGRLIGRLGQGDTNLTVTADGRLVLKEAEITDEKWERYGGDMEFDFGVEMAGMAARIEAEVTNHLSRVTRDIETRFGPNFGRDFAEKMARKSERAAERARRRSEPRGRAAGYDFATTQTPSASKSASTEEQLKILKMVETGKISPEEASMLLEAIEA